MRPSCMLLGPVFALTLGVGTTLKAQSSNGIPYSYHDAHMHAEMIWNHEASRSELNVPVFSRPGFLGGFVISPSYSASSRVTPVADKLAINEAISSAIKNTNNYLLCGTYALDLDVAAFLQPCLRLPKVVGAKMREVYIKGAEGDRDSENQLQYEVFKSVLEILNTRRTILLVHFGEDRFHETECEFKGADDCLYGNREDTQALIDLLKAYRNVILIIAHSGTRSFIGLNGLLQIAASPVAGRVYLETSDGLSDALGVISWEPRTEIDQERADKIIGTWKAFGPDRVLYGTDITELGGSPRNAEAREIHARLIAESPLLSNKEKRQIFKENFETLVRKLGVP